MGVLAADTNHQSSLLDMASLLDAVDGSVIGDCFDSSLFYFSSVVTDSRNVVKGSLFVPLIGTLQDGHKYIPSALEKGASVVFVQKCAFKVDAQTFENYSIQNPEVAFILVKDCMKALQDAARAYVE
jgi:UDP-N-acetylmuramoyl-tripeptide--D-alanyl-D-alanine ligase